MHGLKHFLPQKSRDVLASLYVDDPAISVRSRNRAILSTKSVCVDCNNKRGIRPNPTLKIGDDVIHLIDRVKFLGVHFDRSLTLKPRLQYTKTRCLKALILFKVTAARSLDADCDAKLRQYSALVVSKLDYGSNVYSSARLSYLKTLIQSKINVYISL